MANSPNLIGNIKVSLATTKIFAKGCSLCFGGYKSTVFVTGLCDENCFYCPVNREYLHKDIMKVNERFVNSIEEIIMEISRCGSRGAGITGGEPLKSPKRTTDVIKTLKSCFGSKFHIHLYTTGRHIESNLMKALERAGLDEIRFHPVRDEYLKKLEKISNEINIDFGIEIPAIPGMESWILKMVEFAEKIGCKFVNINELEVSPDNYYYITARGFKIRRDGISVEKSYETALYVMEKALERGLTIPIHFCPSAYKDSIQTKIRFIVSMKNHMEIYEKGSPNGTVYTIILRIKDDGRCINEAMKLTEKSLIFKIKGEYYAYPDDYDNVRTSLKECIEEAYSVEKHPDYIRTLLSKIPLID